jgi:hypothetical protein
MAYETPTTVVASAARTTTGNSGAISAGSRQIALGLSVTAQSGTTPTLDVSIEWSQDGGTTWFVAQPTADAFTQVTTTLINAVRVFVVKAPVYRIVWTIAGTTPSYTFSVREYGIG